MIHRQTVCGKRHFHIQSTFLSKRLHESRLLACLWLQCGFYATSKRVICRRRRKNMVELLSLSPLLLLPPPPPPPPHFPYVAPLAELEDRSNNKGPSKGSNFPINSTYTVYQINQTPKIESGMRKIIDSNGIEKNGFVNVVMQPLRKLIWIAEYNTQRSQDSSGKDQVA